MDEEASSVREGGSLVGFRLVDVMRIEGMKDDAEGRGGRRSVDREDT